jgi:polyhydroxybutyrate depolymerase
MLAPVKWLTPALLIAAGLACNRLDVPLLPALDDPCASWPEPGLYRMSVGSGWTRTPLVWVPNNPRRREAVVMLHGGGGSPEKMQELTEWQDEATSIGFIAVFPAGSGGTGGLTWNAGPCCGYAETVGQPDVEFLEATSAALRSQLCIDRVLAAGHSNGSMMAHRWTCEGTGVDAMIGSAGPLLLDTCEGEPSPVQAWHGTADPKIPFEGGGEAVDPDGFPPVEEAFAKVRARNRCTEDPPAVTVEGDTTCSAWTCEAETIFCAVDGWDHDWPGGLNDRGDGPRIEQRGLAWFFSLADDAPTDTDPPEDTDPA